MNISIIGAGYVGLVSGVCLAEKGHQVTCVDIDADRVNRINAGVSPIHERSLDVLLTKNVGRTFRATTDLVKAVQDTSLTLIAVGTPFKDDEIDLSYVRQAAVDIGHAMKAKHDYHVVVVKSTVVPGTTEDVVRPALEQASGKSAGPDFGVGMNPEFLREGEAVDDFMMPDRIVLGGIDRRTIDTLESLYAVFEGVTVVRTTPRTAELIKYAANSLLATMISFSNEIGNLADALGGIDVVEVMRGVHLDRRLTPILNSGVRVVPGFTTYLEAGCGFGGSCFPKDVKALIAHGERVGSPMRILSQVIGVNEDQPLRILNLIQRHVPDLSGVSVALLGVAFKPGTDDIRESPSLAVLRALLSSNAKVSVFDPAVSEQLRVVFPEAEIGYAQSLPAAIEGAEIIVIMTRWEEFRSVPQLIAGRVPPPLLVDGRRMLDKASVERYEGIGLSSDRGIR